jgi:hypothetical protein
MTAGHSRTLRAARPARWLLTSVAMMLGWCVLVPGTAFAGVGLGLAPTMPTNSTVGDVGLPGSLTLTNLNTSPDVTSTVCNTGDALPCPAGDEGITLIPSCGAQGAFSVCTSADPGVYRISTTATGGAGTACAGMAFTVTPLGDSFGKVRFAPTLAGTNVVLPSFGTSCRIDFSVDVLKVPAFDAQPGVAGVQTIQVTDATQRSNIGTTGSSRGSATGSTVNPPPPPPPAPPPQPPCVPGPGPAPPGQMLCTPPVVPSSGPGPATAQISGVTGCATQNFNVTVTGQQIRRVVFTLDGRGVKILTKPNSGGKYVLAVRPGRLRRGTHRVVATTTFTAASRTRTRTLRVVFQRCTRSVSAPRFTG